MLICITFKAVGGHSHLTL